MRDVGFDLLNEASLVSQAALLTLSALISQYFMEFGAMALMSTLVSFELPIRVREGRQLLSSMHNQSIQCRRALPLQRKIVARCDPYLRYSLNPSSVAEDSKCPCCPPYRDELARIVATWALMNTRRLMELIAVNIGYDMGMLFQRIFTMLGIMASVTTVMTGPLVTLFGKTHRVSRA